MKLSAEQEADARARVNAYLDASPSILDHGKSYPLQEFHAMRNKAIPEIASLLKEYLRGAIGLAFFKEQNSKGAGVWKDEFTNLRAPKLFNLRADPFERGDESMLYNKWALDRVFIIVPAQALAAQWIQSFKEFPPRHKPASYNLDELMQKMEQIGSSAN